MVPIRMLAEPSKGQTALMWAIGERHPDIVRLLIQGGADVRVRSKGGSTPLLLAARMGDLESAKLLLAGGADVNETMPKERKDFSGTPFPASQGRDNGADGASALLVATIRGSVELAKFLLDHGADPNKAGRRVYHAALGLWLVGELCEHHIWFGRLGLCARPMNIGLNLDFRVRKTPTW